VINYNKINIFLREHCLTFLFIIILCPIFVSLDLSQGLKFNEFYYGLHNPLYKYPSIPISALIILVLSVWNIKGLLCNKRIQILSILVSIYIGLNLSFGITRGAIVGIGMMLIITSYYNFLRIINDRNVYKNFYVALASVIAVKLFFDLSMNIMASIIYFSQLEFSNHLKFSNYFVKNISNGEAIKFFSTRFFISKNFVIYNYYDYFPFIYYLSATLSVQNLLRRRYLILSLIVLVFSNLSVIGSGSRLFMYSIYLIPFLYIFYQFTKLSLDRYFYLFLFVSFAIILIVAFSEFQASDISLMSRYTHIHQYFENFSLVNLIFPFLNEHRIQSSGSLHNELLEIFSFFGFVIVYYLFLLKQIFCNTKKEFKFIAYLLIFVLIIGTLIQINISNPYVGIITGALFAVISSGPTKIRHQL
jgi:hypothetical protein